MKLILTDADGVLLNWMHGFQHWALHNHGLKEKNIDSYHVQDRYEIDYETNYRLVGSFCNSSSIGFLPPHKDAVMYVRKLYEEHGFVFRVITSVSTDPHTQQLRRMNLERLFGPAIDDIVCLDTGADKDEALDQYRDSGLYWIEDKPANIVAGNARGLTTIQMIHDHHSEDDLNLADFNVTNWREIYSIVTYGEN